MLTSRPSFHWMTVHNFVSFRLSYPHQPRIPSRPSKQAHMRPAAKALYGLATTGSWRGRPSLSSKRLIISLESLHDTNEDPMHNDVSTVGHTDKSWTQKLGVWFAGSLAQLSISMVSTPKFCARDFGLPVMSDRVRCCRNREA